MMMMVWLRMGVVGVELSSSTVVMVDLSVTMFMYFQVRVGGAAANGLRDGN